MYGMLAVAILEEIEGNIRVIDHRAAIQNITEQARTGVLHHMAQEAQVPADNDDNLSEDGDDDETDHDDDDNDKRETLPVGWGLRRTKPSEPPLPYKKDEADPDDD